MAQINKPNLHFNPILWTGNGSTQNITGVSHTPDFVWIKKRTDTDGARIFDTIRGATKAIFTNSTAEETTVTSELSAFGSDGYTLGASDAVNGNTKQYVGWNWKAGGTSSSNTDGSITTTVSANTTAGFSIVSYTGTGSAGTIGHGLGVTPKMYIIKKRDTSGTDWTVGGSVLGGTTSSRKMTLNGTGAVTTGLDASWWNSTNPTSSVISIGTQGDLNGSGGTYIAYCFAEKKGFSKFGSYEGNGNADGTFVYTGFKPAFVITKRADTGGDNWHILDNKRDIDNSAKQVISANSNSAEATTSSSEIDFLSNGFKCRGTGSSINTSGLTYIYIAFAEEPLVANVGESIPATAR